jgi:hypothetical protein
VYAYAECQKVCQWPHCHNKSAMSVVSISKPMLICAVRVSWLHTHTHVAVLQGGYQMCAELLNDLIESLSFQKTRERIERCDHERRKQCLVQCEFLQHANCSSCSDHSIDAREPTAIGQWFDTNASEAVSMCQHSAVPYRASTSCEMRSSISTRNQHQCRCSGAPAVQVRCALGAAQRVVALFIATTRTVVQYDAKTDQQADAMEMVVDKQATGGGQVQRWPHSRKMPRTHRAANQHTRRAESERDIVVAGLANNLPIRGFSNTTRGVRLVRYNMIDSGSLQLSASQEVEAHHMAGNMHYQSTKYTHTSSEQPAQSIQDPKQPYELYGHSVHDSVDISIAPCVLYRVVSYCIVLYRVVSSRVVFR